MSHRGSENLTFYGLGGVGSEGGKSSVVSGGGGYRPTRGAGAVAAMRHRAG